MQAYQQANVDDIMLSCVVEPHLMQNAFQQNDVVPIHQSVQRSLTSATP